MRRAAAVDSNHQQIIRTLEAAGCFVQSLATVGNGVADLLVCHRGRLELLEVKDGKKPPSRRALTPDEAKWHAKVARHGGRVWVVLCPEDALAAMGLARNDDREFDADDYSGRPRK